jgi:hypothetical protein
VARSFVMEKQHRSGSGGHNRLFSTTSSLRSTTTRYASRQATGRYSNSARGAAVLVGPAGPLDAPAGVS